MPLQHKPVTRVKQDNTHSSTYTLGEAMKMLQAGSTSVLHKLGNIMNSGHLLHPTQGTSHHPRWVTQTNQC